MAKVNKRLAVLVGCNYPNTEYELHGCINDVVAMKDVLLLTDASAATGEGSSSMVLPTGENIEAALSKMVSQAEAGDVFYFHYSGHGTRIPKPAHLFGPDEAIVPCDFNLITKEKEQIGPSTYRATSPLSYKAKNIPFESILENLTTLTGINTSDVDETSADMNPIESGGKAYGAFSNAVQMVLKENSGGLSNKEVVMMARKVFPEAEPY
ncbi:hypothetical protein GOBAR_AA24496 [Gossypium barbadense]|uniref:Peptidase C14 caspase domain-containing protein n=1 Tax=Gossypium barbadense TaxID=3634 RepID=A0A2P5WYJ1_GOSBA|nr:hypothetical protein GOBAR_AA24496 [Gossypium barbadense]